VLMSQGVVYLLTHIQLAARLVVSLYSLRRWYHGPITVFTTRPESHEIGKRCADDPNLRVRQEVCLERPGLGYTSSYLTKTTILERSPYRLSVFLDADTIVNGDIAELFAHANEAPLVATNFCSWTTMVEPTSNYLERWRTLQDGSVGKAFDLKDRIDRLLQNPYPAVNAGVFAFRNVRRVLRRWDALTWAARGLPMPDEISLQLMLLETKHRMLGSQFNCHPNTWRPGLEARIWHFAGRSHLARGRCEQIWLPLYKECRQRRIAGIDEWSKVRSRPKRRSLAKPTS
jgi:hypothetical protein